MALESGSQALDNWENVQVPVYFNVYFFDVLNPDEIADGSWKEIKVKQRGPYVFNEKKTKDIIDMDDNHITYEPINTYVFNQEMSSSLTLDDNITAVNVPLMVLPL